MPAAQYILEMDELFNAIKTKFPDDSDDKINEWMDLAEEYGQPLTVDEYQEWRDN